MAQFQPSSFIPQEQIIQTSAVGRRRKSSVNLFMVIAVIIFIAALACSVGVFLLQRFSLSQIQAKKNALEDVQKTLNPELIREIVRADNRLQKATSLLDNHIVLSPFFEELNKSTLRSVQFTSLDLSPVEDGSFEAVLEGITDNYTNVALQSDELGRNDYFLDPIVSNFELNEAGDVTFGVRLKVDKILASYTSLIKGSLNTN